MPISKSAIFHETHYTRLCRSDRRCSANLKGYHKLQPRRHGPLAATTLKAAPMAALERIRENCLIRFRYKLAAPKDRGQGMTSRMFFIPVTYIIILSKPIPNPE